MNTPVIDNTLAQQAIGQIAVDLPGATAIFRRLKLDFCCGGQISLAQACERKGLDTTRVVSQNSDSDGAASSASACSIRLLTGAKPVSQAAKTSGRGASARTNSPLGPHSVTAVPGLSPPAKNRVAIGSASLRAM